MLLLFPRWRGKRYELKAYLNMGWKKNHSHFVISIMPSNHHYNKNLQPFANKLRKNITKAEACLWKYILKVRQLKGYQFHRQRPVLNYIADFMCKKLWLIIEVDGFTHQFEETIINDKKRQANLEAAGFTVLRFIDEELLNRIHIVRSLLEQWIEKKELSIK